MHAKAWKVITATVVALVFQTVKHDNYVHARETKVKPSNAQIVDRPVREDKQRVSQAQNNNPRV